MKTQTDERMEALDEKIYELTSKINDLRADLAYALYRKNILDGQREATSQTVKINCGV